MNRPQVTFILATHNRRDILLDTLGQLMRDHDVPSTCEIIVVDNASRDGTPHAVADRFPQVTLLARAGNLGSCAKAVAVDRARGEYIVFLDDDSRPWRGCVQRMIRHFEDDAQLGSAGFVVHLPNGGQECSAFENVFIGCGAGFRATALRQVGGLDAGFFMQAEEFDLSFRLVNAGWRVETFDDLHVDHLKTPQARLSARTTYYDTRNNLMVIDRYLSEPYAATYRRDWLQRYRWIAAANRHPSAYARAVLAASWRRRRERRQFAPHRLRHEAFETLFRLEFVARKMHDLRREGVKSIVLADFGKNIHAFHDGARRAGLTLYAIADDRFARPNRRYRDTPIIPTSQINRLHPDAVVISNTAPAHAAATHKRLESTVTAPMHRWFRIRETIDDVGFSYRNSSNSSDTDAPYAVNAVR